MARKNPKRESDRDKEKPKTGRAEERPRGRAGYTPEDSRKERAVKIKTKVRAKNLPKGPKKT